MKSIQNLPQEIQYEIYLYIHKKCDLCSQNIEFWNLYCLKDIYRIKLHGNSFQFIYLFQNNSQKVCYYCYSMIKFWLN